MKIAQFEYTGAFKGMHVFRNESGYMPPDLVRISEWVDVSFPLLSAEEVIPEQVAALDREIEALTVKFTKALVVLQDHKSELLAITDQRQVA